MFCLGDVHNMVNIETVETESYIIHLQFVFFKGECYVMMFHMWRFCLRQRIELHLMGNRVFQRFKKSNTFLSELIFSQIFIIFQISTGNSVVFFLKSRKYDAELVGLVGRRHSKIILYYIDYADCVLNENKAAKGHISESLSHVFFVWES